MFAPLLRQRVREVLSRGPVREAMAACPTFALLSPDALGLDCSVTPPSASRARRGCLAAPVGGRPVPADDAGLAPTLLAGVPGAAEAEGDADELIDSLVGSNSGDEKEEDEPHDTVEHGGGGAAALRDLLATGGAAAEAAKCRELVAREAAEALRAEMRPASHGPDTPWPLVALCREVRAAGVRVSEGPVPSAHVPTGGSACRCLRATLSRCGRPWRARRARRTWHPVRVLLDPRACPVGCASHCLGPSPGLAFAPGVPCPVDAAAEEEGEDGEKEDEEAGVDEEEGEEDAAFLHSAGVDDDALEEGEEAYFGVRLRDTLIVGLDAVGNGYAADGVRLAVSRLQPGAKALSPRLTLPARALHALLRTGQPSAERGAVAVSVSGAEQRVRGAGGHGAAEARGGGVRRPRRAGQQRGAGGHRAVGGHRRPGAQLGHAARGAAPPADDPVRVEGGRPRGARGGARLRLSPAPRVHAAARGARAGGGGRSRGRCR